MLDILPLKVASSKPDDEKFLTVRYRIFNALDIRVELHHRQKYCSYASTWFAQPAVTGLDKNVAVGGVGHNGTNAVCR
jgi:hypothetical protein